MRRLVALSILLASGFIPLEAVEIKKDGWLFPNPTRAEKKAIRSKDYTDRIPGPETLVKIYKKKNEDVAFETFEIDGEVYACQFHIKGKEWQPTTVYVIVDMDGDGVYETKYSAGESPTPPEWVIQRYYRKHPDQKDPDQKDPGPDPGAPRTQ